jgi:rubrerythrin
MELQKLEELKQKNISEDENALPLLKDGFDQVKTNTTSRIYLAHRSVLKINLCPACGFVARTPAAKQCRFCRHDWH